jgi:hypothetical protein
MIAGWPTGPNMMWPLLFRRINTLWPDHFYSHYPDCEDV